MYGSSQRESKGCGLDGCTGRFVLVNSGHVGGAKFSLNGCDNVEDSQHNEANTQFGNVQILLSPWEAAVCSKSHELIERFSV